MAEYENEWEKPFKSEIEKAKQQAAYKAVDECFSEEMKIIGIGSGSTVAYAVERIAQKKVKDMIFIPTGFQSRQLILDLGLYLGDVDVYSTVDIVFDGADEVDDDLNCIKGGGACLFQEKLVASSAKKKVIIADYRKKSHILGEKWHQGIPVEVIPVACSRVMNNLIRLGSLGPKLRPCRHKAGPMITDHGNFIIDAPFGKIKHPEVLEKNIKMIIGVVEVGLFVNIADVVYFGNEDETVISYYKERKN
ncbi:ribose 5-phosphate isomerase A [Pneumocystis carinii B80]|uniref:Ribose-5-phosphate isomerase n=1 Tax=Pneumocystis carinii (strain B80) TaxID=1408658 RepID=A0A0W4ZKF5_PNEC8|nr:ribose 5-phosphate isomerase A [Pneumocystis carinii B80]KTW28848.1 ribose 5-phosphate isomerase A [Pneumocystis carinii B80]